MAITKRDDVYPWQHGNQKGQLRYNEPQSVVSVIAAHWPSDILLLLFGAMKISLALSLGRRYPAHPSLTRWPLSVMPTLISCTVAAPLCHKVYEFNTPAPVQ